MTHGRPPDDSFRRVNPDLLRFLPPDARIVVEVGCGAGALAAEYRRANPGVRYVGVEADPDAADEARHHLDHVLWGNVEKVAKAALAVKPGTADVLVFGEVLERLSDPWAVLRRFAPLLAPGGLALACVPNVQHASLIAQLLRGSWKYEAGGPLDRAHLRFFTLESLVETFAGAGLRVFDARPRAAPSAEQDKLLDLLTPVAEALGAKGPAFRARAAATHYVVRAIRANHAVRPLLVQAHLAPPPGNGSGPVRVAEPEEFLNTVPGVWAASGSGPIDPSAADDFADKVFVWQRTPLTPDRLAAHRELIARGFVTVFELDDDPGHPNLAAVAADDGFALRACHAVQTTTEELADRLRRFNPNVAVFPNQIARLPAAPAAGANPAARDGVVTVFFGAFNREADWADLIPAVNRVAGRFGDRVRFRVVYDRMFFDALATPHKAFTPGCDRDTYLREVAASDVALLPLLPTAFNRAKSDLKYLECAAHGAVVLASPTVYGGSVADGKTGLLFADAAEFEAKLTRLVEDAALRGRLRDAALAAVRADRMLGRHYRRRLDWYRELVARREELTAAVWERVPTLRPGRPAR